MTLNFKCSVFRNCSLLNLLYSYFYPYILLKCKTLTSFVQGASIYALKNNTGALEFLLICVVSQQTCFGRCWVHNFSVVTLFFSKAFKIETNCLCLLLTFWQRISCRMMADRAKYNHLKMMQKQNNTGISLRRGCVMVKHFSSRALLSHGHRRLTNEHCHHGSPATLL